MAGPRAPRPDGVPGPGRYEGPGYRGDTSRNRLEEGRRPLTPEELEGVRARRSGAQEAAGKVRLRGKGASVLVDLADLQFDATSGSYLYRGRPIDEGQIAWENESQRQAVRANAIEMDPGLEDDAASPEGTPLEQRTEPAGSPQAFTRQDILRTIDQVHDTSEALVERMVRDSTMATGNKPRVRPKFAGKALDPKTASEQFIAAAIDLRREMAKPSPNTDAAWKHTQKLLGLMRGKDWAKELIPGFDRAAAMADVDPAAAGRVERAAMQGDFVTDPDAPRMRPDPDSLISEEVPPVQTPVLRGPQENRNAAAAPQEAALRNSQANFANRLQALARTIRGTFSDRTGPDTPSRGDRMNSTDDATRAQLQRIVKEGLGQASGLGDSADFLGDALESPKTAVQAIENFLRSQRSTDGSGANYPTQPAGEAAVLSSPTPERVLDKKYNQGKDIPPGIPLDEHLALVAREAAQSAPFAAGERAQRAQAPAPRPRLDAGGTVQRPDAIRARMAELNAEATEALAPQGYETVNPDARLAPAIEVRIGNRTRDRLPESSPEELTELSRYRVRVEGTPQRPVGGQPLQSTNKPMLIRMIPKRDGSGQWEDLSPLPASVIQYDDKYLIISQGGSPLVVDVAAAQTDKGVVPAVIKDLSEARAIVNSAQPVVIQTPSDVARAYDLYNNRQREKNNDWISMYQQGRSQPFGRDWTQYIGENVDPNSQFAAVLRTLGIDRRLMENQRGVLREKPGSITENRGIEVADRNRVTEESAGAAATELLGALRSYGTGRFPVGPRTQRLEATPLDIRPETLATVMSYLEANPELRVDDLIAGPTVLDQVTDMIRRRSADEMLQDLAQQRGAIESDTRLSEAQKAERLAGVATREYEARSFKESVDRVKALLQDPGRVSQVFAPIVDGAGDVDAATPMTLYAVDWLKRNNPQAFTGPGADVRARTASQIERVVADQYFRPPQDMGGQRQGIGPQAGAWKTRMKDEMSRLGIGNLAIFGDLEDRVNLQLQSKGQDFDPMSVSAGEAAGLAGARGGLAPDRRRKAGPRPDIDDNPALGMIERTESTPTGLMSDELANSMARSGAMNNPAPGSDPREGRTPRPELSSQPARTLVPDGAADTDGAADQLRSSPRYVRLAAEAEYLAAQMGLPDDQISGDLSTIVPAMRQRLRDLVTASGSDPAAMEINDGYASRLAGLERAVEDLVPREDSSDPGSFARLFGNDDQRRAFARVLFGDDSDTNMRMLYLNWLNNPMARNAIDRGDAAGVNPFFAAPRQSLEGVDQGAYEASAVEWFFSRLNDLGAERAAARLSDKGDEVSQALASRRVAQIDSEVSALMDQFPGVMENYQQFKDEIGNVFRRELEDLSYSPPEPAQVGPPTTLGALREFFSPQEAGSRTPFGDRYRTPMNRVAEPDRNTRIAELQAFLRTVDDVGRNPAGKFPETVTGPEQELLKFAATDAQSKLTADEIVALQQLVQGRPADIPDTTLRKLENAGIFGEAILRRDKTVRQGEELFPPERLGMRREQVSPLPWTADKEKLLTMPRKWPEPIPGSRPEIDPNPPASRLARIRELQQTLAFARTPEERQRVLRDIEQAQAGVNVVDTQETPTLSTVDRAERTGLPVSGVEAVEQRMRDIDEVAQMVRDARVRARPQSSVQYEGGPVALPRNPRETARKRLEAVGPLGDLQVDESQLQALPDMLQGTGFYADTNTPGGRLLESIAGLRRPVTAGEIMSARGAAAAPRSPAETATKALQGLAALRDEDGRRMGIDISPFSPDDPDLAQQLGRMADEFERMAVSDEGQLPNRYLDDNSEQLSAIARAYRNAAEAVNQAYIDTRPQRGILDDAAPGVGLDDQAAEAQPRVYLGGNDPMSGQPQPTRPSFFRNKDGTTFLRVTAEDGGSGRPIFVPVDTNIGAQRPANFRVDAAGALVPTRPGVGVKLQDQGAAPAPFAERSRAPAGEFDSTQEYFDEKGWLEPEEEAPPAPQTGDEFYDNAPANRMDDELGAAALPAMGGMALNQPAGDTNMYAEDPEAVLRRLRRSGRPVAGLV